MSTIYLRGNLRAIEKALREEPKIAKRAAISAINKTAGRAQTDGVKRLGIVKKIPARAIKTRVKIAKAGGRRLYASIVVLAAGFPIDKLKYRQLGKTKKVGKGFSAAGQKFSHAFFAYRGEGTRGTAKQREMIFQRKGSGRLPIERVKIELQPEADDIFKIAINRAVSFQLPKIFESELKYRRAL